MVGGVIIVVGTEVEDRLCTEVAERDVVGATKGVLVHVHDQVLVVVPMLVAAGAVGAVDAEVHRRLQNVPVDVLQHGGDFHVLFIGVEIWAGPSVVGEGFTGRFVCRPRDAHHVHVDVKAEFFVLWQAHVAVVVGEGVGPAKSFFLRRPQGQEGVAFELQFREGLGVEHDGDRSGGVVVSALVSTTTGWAPGWRDVHVGPHALHAGVPLRAVLPSNDVQALRLCWVVVVQHSHQRGPVAQPLKVTVEERGSPLKGRVAGAHPAVDVAAALRAVVAHAEDVPHAFQPCLTADDGGPVGDLHFDGLLDAIALGDGEGGAVDVGRGQQAARHGTRFANGDHTVADQRVVDEDESVHGHAQARVFAAENEVVPCTGGHGNVAWVLPVDEQHLLNGDRFHLLFPDATGQRGQQHEHHQQQRTDGRCLSHHGSPFQRALIALGVGCGINRGRLSIRFCSR